MNIQTNLSKAMIKLKLKYSNHHDKNNYPYSNFITYGQLIKMHV